jgi:hypothetical protein
MRSLHIESSATVLGKFDFDFDENLSAINYYFRKTTSDEGATIYVNGDGDEIVKIKFSTNEDIIYINNVATAQSVPPDVWYRMYYDFNYTTHEVRVRAYNHSSSITEYDAWHAFANNEEDIDGFYFGGSGPPDRDFYIDELNMTGFNNAPSASNPQPASGTFDAPLYMPDLNTTVSIDLANEDCEWTNCTFFYLFFTGWSVPPPMWRTTSVNFTGSGQVNASLSNLNAGSKVYWYVNMTDEEGNVDQYPKSGELIENPIGYTNYCWNFTLENNSLPVISNIDPLDGSDISPDDWDNELSFDVSDAEGDSITVSMFIRSNYGVAGFSYEILNGSANASVTLDMSPYGLVFAGCWYNVTLLAYDDMHPVLEVPYYTNFTIGGFDPALLYHIALRNPVPAYQEMNGYEVLTNGITFEAISNVGLSSGGIELWWYVTEQCSRVTSNDSRIIAEGHETVYLRYYGFTPIWTSFRIDAPFRTRETYRVFIGVRYATGEPYTWANTQFTCIGIDNFRPTLASNNNDYKGNFTRSLYNPNLATIAHYIWEGYTAPSTNTHRGRMGVRLAFCTYPTGEEPSTYQEGAGDQTTGSNWYLIFDKFEEDTGVWYLRIIAGMLLVLAFTLIPYVATKHIGIRILDKHGKYTLYNKEVPSTVMVSFALMGTVLAFGMGLFPLWIFIPPVIVVSMIFIYKVINYYKSVRGGMSDEI